MHELSIAMSILDAVQDEMEMKGYGIVEAVHVRIGALSGVVPEALRSAYELAAEQTPLAQSRLVIEDVPVRMYCPNCSREQPVMSIYMMCCAHCETPASDVISGRELEISGLELAS